MIKASFEADFQEACRLRGWIINAYAQIEFLLGDLILRCRAFPEYLDDDLKFSHRVAYRVKIMRRILSRAGPLTPFAAELISIMDRFEDRQDTRNLLTHGFCTYLCTPGGDAGFQFQKFHRERDREDAQLIRTFRLPDLANEEQSITGLCQEAIHLFVQIHDRFGWIAKSEGLSSA